ncbi:unnamed protein product [Mortierella alpina]
MTSVTQWENINKVNELQISALAINLGTNVGLSLLTLGAFCWLRPKNGVIYARKYKVSPQDKRAPKLAEGYFSWMQPVWRCPDDELVDKIGLDAVVFIRFIRQCRQIFILMAIIGCGILIPINVVTTIRAQPDGKMPTDKISMLTIAEIMDLKFLWAHVAGIWTFSGIMIFAIFHAYRSFLRYRIRYFESAAYQENMASRTLMLAGLPNSLQSDDKLAKFMSGLDVKEKPVQAVVGRKVDKLPELMEKHKKMVTALEKVLTKHYSDPNKPPKKRPTVSTGHICGSKVDAIDYYSGEIEELSRQIEQARADLSKSQPTNYGFVSYATIQAAHRVAKELSNPIAFRTKSKMIDPPDLFLSPVPKDIIWFNASNPKQLRKTRRIIVNTLFVIGSLLFFIPMGSLSTLAKLDRIIGFFPSTKDYFETHKFVAGMVQSLLPVLFMDILFMIVRKLITYMAWFQGNITKSSIDRSTLAKFYLFFTLNNLIVFALSSTIIGFFAQLKIIFATFSFSRQTWEALKTFMHAQDNIVQLLSKNVIDTSLFWVNYISLRNFSALLDLFQLVSLFLYWAKSTVTARESKKMDKPLVFDFPLFFSAHMFLLTVALLYSVVAPLVLFFAAIYFSLASLVYKYQLMYVFRTKVETGGRLFRVIYNRLLAALILFQVVMIGVLNLKTAHTHSLAVLPLPIITILFKVFLSKQYDPKIDYYDYGSARNELHLQRNGGKGNSLSRNFENPVLRAKMIAALVPDGAKRMLSSTVLHGGRDNVVERKPNSRHGSSKQQYGRRHSLGDDTAPEDHKGHQNHLESESFEMGHISKGSRSDNHFQTHGSDSVDNQSKYSYESKGTPLPRYDNKSQHTLGADDPMDDYFDDQKQSLTQAASQRYADTYNSRGPASPPTKPAPSPPQKVYAAQDMTSFVAGRYKADQTADAYIYNSRRNQNKNEYDAAEASTTPEAVTPKASYMELARMHQTDNYKSTGKATQYEDNNKLHLPPMNLHMPKIPITNPRKPHRKASDHQLQKDPFQDSQQQEYQSSSPVMGKSSRMPQVQAPAHQSSSRRKYNDAPVLQHSASSPALDTGDDYGYAASVAGTDMSEASTPRMKHITRAQIQGGSASQFNSYSTINTNPLYNSNNSINANYPYNSVASNQERNNAYHNGQSTYV